MKVRLAVDCMGGDHGVDVTVKAALAFARHNPEADLVLVGDREAIAARLGKLTGTAARLSPASTTPSTAPAPAETTPPEAAASGQETADGAAGEVRSGRSARRIEQILEAGGLRFAVVHATEVVRMDDAPAIALRSRRGSSMRLALDLVRDGRADACVSAGNTGALMAIARFVLKTLDGIDRPAIAYAMPNARRLADGRDGATTTLDLGANVDCTAEHLLQFAVLGTALASAIYGIERPSVGLLNIGEEVIKGNEVVKRAGELLRASGLNFRGNVEGNDIFGGATDVVVCDGFVGNVALKTSEGLARMVAGFLREEFSRSWYSRLAALVAMPVLLRFRRRVDPGRHNGAALLGLRGIVIKSHGSADSAAFESALQRGYFAAQYGLVERTAAAMAVMAATCPPPTADPAPAGIPAHGAPAGSPAAIEESNP